MEHEAQPHWTPESRTSFAFRLHNLIYSLYDFSQIDSQERKEQHYRGSAQTSTRWALYPERIQ